jgi:hypothetical protein
VAPFTQHVADFGSQLFEIGIGLVEQRRLALH